MIEPKEILSTAKESFYKITDNIKDRTRNPFVFSFILSFIAYNWKPFSIVLKSESKIEETILYLKNGQYEHIDGYLQYPIIIALIYTFLVPLLDVLRGIIVGIYKSLEDFILSSFELLYYDKKIKLENRKSDFENKSDLNNKIEELQSQLNESEKKIDNLDSDNKRLILDLDRVENQKTLRNKEIDELAETISKTEKELFDLIQTNSSLQNRLSENSKYLDIIKTELKNSDGFGYSPDEVDDYSFEYETTRKDKIFIKSLADFMEKFFNNLDNPNLIVPDLFMNRGLFRHIDFGDNGFYKLTKKGMYFWHRINQDLLNEPATKPIR